MNILIINQHTCNRGDEAAGKALLTALSRMHKDFQLGVLYNTRRPVGKDSLIGVSVCPHARHYSYGRGVCKRYLCMLSMILPFGKVLARLNPDLTKEYRLIRDADIIINAPGGVNIGPYKDWMYLWRLYVSITLRKNVAVYSISLGPFPEAEGILGHIFSEISKKVLGSVDLLALRDARSQAYASQLGLSYVPSADTAFLCDGYTKDLPPELQHLLSREFVILVPNELNAWHPMYRHVNPHALKELYQRICCHVLAKGYRVVMLPQLFGAQDDVTYMRAIAAMVGSNDIEVIPDYYDSDIQQRIVSQALLLIGARYHSIVFGINNEIPFLSLAYEHKMSDMLSMLGLEDHNFNLDDLSSFDVDALLRRVDYSLTERQQVQSRIRMAKSHARELAEKTFGELAAMHLGSAGLR